MKTFLVAALLSATAAIAAPTKPAPAKAPAAETKAPASTDVQADPHAPAKTETKAEATPEAAPSGRTETMMQGTGTKKPVKAPASEKSAQ
ncbi:hypothetical protein [Corallococcus sp. CA049B]|uniref:hypothetical protein n=1 Tax=Corallococcus sp. CA049B TaxID=2316730 RepID=UPI0013155FAD|nr:hypothetical protein [Corallococcus sp. CA049B]